MASTPRDSWGSLASSTPFMTEIFWVLGGGTGYFQSPFTLLTTKPEYSSLKPCPSVYTENGRCRFSARSLWICFCFSLKCRKSFSSSVWSCACLFTYLRHGNALCARILAGSTGCVSISPSGLIRVKTYLHTILEWWCWVHKTRNDSIPPTKFGNNPTGKSCPTGGRRMIFLTRKTIPWDHCWSRISLKKMR